MSRDLGKVEGTILDICIECVLHKKLSLALYEDSLHPKVWCYPGGESNLSTDGKYTRIVRIGRRSKEKRNMERRIIDLREVSYLFKKRVDRKNLPSYYRALHSLIRKKYIMPFYIIQRRQLRFVVLNADKSYKHT